MHWALQVMHLAEGLALFCRYEGGDLSHEDGRLWREQRPRESSRGQRQKPRGHLKCGAERRHQGNKERRPPSGRATGEPKNCSLRLWSLSSRDSCEAEENERWKQVLRRPL